MINEECGLDFTYVKRLAINDLHYDIGTENFNNFVFNLHEYLTKEEECKKLKGNQFLIRFSFATSFHVKTNEKGISMISDIQVVIKHRSRDNYIVNAAA